ncbi:hypothetical protein ANO14919_039160 [Xylariales sp. No.14919]|nr:heterokaryon incompatibility protein-domain-containing protein [Xylaria grammica]GAW14513.1 hypothetical protein ANO14919_039160 [Xylariales sp. No.14919]
MMNTDDTQRLEGLYGSLPLGGRQIRIIYLRPGSGDTDVFVDISVESLDAQPNQPQAYYAMSWQWGSQNPESRTTIYIQRWEQNGPMEREWIPMLVSPNLLWALKRIRLGRSEVRLWVDAICINQRNKDEKSRQVSMMTDIYRKATEVKIWLGEPGHRVSDFPEDDITDREVKEAVRQINALGNLDDANHIGSVDTGILDKAKVHDLEPLFKLFRRGWFGRRWIVQEVAVAQRAVVYCGKETFTWDRLAHAIAILERIGRDGSINRLFKMQRSVRHVSEHVGNISALAAYRLVQNTFGFHRKLDDRIIAQYTLEQLVCFLVVFQSSEPHDIIYATIGLASDFTPVNEGGGTQIGGKTTFHVTYDRPPLQTYKYFLKEAMQRSKSLDIFCRPWAPQGVCLPSWILDITRKPFRATRTGKMVRYNADPFVGPAVTRLQFYTASGRADPTCQITGGRFFEMNNDDTSKEVIVYAFELATINNVWGPAVHGNIPPSWLEAGDWMNDNKLPPDELWRTLVGDRTSDGNPPEPWYSTVFQSAVRERGIQYGISTTELLHERDNMAYYEVFRRVQAVVWNRKLIRANLNRPQGKWHPLGLVPEKVENTDSIFIVLGCSVPLVLRKYQPEEDNQPQQDGVEKYTVIGECYLDAMMDGRALSGNVWTKIKLE